MLSILIPTYNYDCTRLVRDLHTQAESAGIDYEIIVADDATPIAAYKEMNRKINSLPHCQYIELTENIGRARIRNYLANRAKHEWLLFMDADAEVIGQNFIANYLAYTDAEIICGGLCHATVLPSPEVSLRYAYEHRADRKRAAKYRQIEPYERFTPFNFMIRRTLFLSILFDDSITEYGHEDTLFGLELAQRKADIRHIDNPLRHIGLESNAIFLEKTRAAIRNLNAMEDTLKGHSSLISAYNTLRYIGISRCIAEWFRRKQEQLERHLTGDNPKLCVFFFYKLGYYCNLKVRSEEIVKKTI